MRMRELRSAQKQLLEFVGQFAPLLGRSERGHWCGMYVSGLLLDGDRKSIEPMAGRLPGGNEQALQQFVNQSPWEHGLVFDKLTEVMLGQLNPGRGVLVLDDTSLPKKGGTFRGCCPPVLRRSGESGELPKRGELAFFL